MVIVRGTTPEIICTIPEEIELTNAKEIWVSIGQSGKVINKTLSNNDVIINEHTLLLRLTQEETLSLSSFIDANIDIRILLNDDTALASINKGVIDVRNVIKGGVIE